MRLEKVNRVAALAALVILFAAAALPGRLYAQKAASQQQPAKGEFNYTEGPSIFGAYSYPNIPRPSLANSPGLDQLIQNNKLELSLDSAIQLALQNNLDIAVARYQLPLAKLDILRTKAGSAARGVSGSVVSQALFAGAIGAGVNGASGASSAGGGSFSGGGVVPTSSLGPGDPITGASFGWNNSVVPLNQATVYGIPLFSSHTSSYSTFFGKGFFTGTSVIASVSGYRQSSVSNTSLFNPEISTGLTAGFNQHLLKGFGRRANAVFIRIANNDLNVADSVFRQQVITTIAAVLNAYYTLLADRDQVRVAQSAVNYSEKLVDDDKKQVQIGTLAPLDVVQAESELASDQQSLIVAKTTYLQQEEVIKTLISKRVTSALAGVQLDATDNLPEPKPNDIPSLEEALTTALKKRPEIEQDELNLRNQNYTIQSNRNGLLPTLDAFATYQSNGLAGVPYIPLVPTGSGGLGESLSQVFTGKYPSYSVGLTLQIPIGNHVEQANAAQAVVELHEMQTSIQRQKNQIEQDVRNAEIAVTQAKAQIDAAIKAKDYAQQALDAENKKLRLGVSTTLNVILLQRDLITAEGNLAKARQAYAQALVQYHQATGTILDAHNIVLKDPDNGVYSRQKSIPGSAATPISQP
jgi:outer membrane protein